MIRLATVMVALVAGQAASEDILCGQYETHTNWPYTVNNNAWNEDESGAICTHVCDTCSDISFYSLWRWTSQPITVHAYPNVELKSSNLPLQLRNLASLYVSATWDFAPASLTAGKDPNTKPDASENISNNFQANVVLDVFADADREMSQTPSKQKYELMVWVGVFGDASWPIGKTAPRDPPVIARLNNTDFTLYNGTNSNGQFVYSWVTNQTLTAFGLDFAPLFGYLWKEEGIPDDVYLGTIQFGSETFSSDSQMNFSVWSFEARVERTIPDASGTGEPTATLPVAAAVSLGLELRVLNQDATWQTLPAIAFFLSGCLMLI